MIAVASSLPGMSLGQTVIESAPSLPTLPFNSPPSTPEAVSPTRIQGGFPNALVLPPPSEASIRRENRFVEAEINSELPLSIVVGRSKILRLSETPKRIYVPSEDIIHIGTHR